MVDWCCWMVVNDGSWQFIMHDSWWWLINGIHAGGSWSTTVDVCCIQYWIVHKCWYCTPNTQKYGIYGYHHLWKPKCGRVMTWRPWLWLPCAPGCSPPINDQLLVSLLGCLQRHFWDSCFWPHFTDQSMRTGTKYISHWFFWLLTPVIEHCQQLYYISNHHSHPSTNDKPGCIHQYFPSVSDPKTVETLKLLPLTSQEHWFIGDGTRWYSYTAMNLRSW